MLNSTTIETILKTLPGKTVAVLGDLFLDRYLDLDGSLTEPSLETGLPAYQVVRVRSLPGAAGTIVNNLAALGVGRILPVSVIGDDGEGYELRQALAAIPAVDTSGVLLRADRRTPTYCKPMLTNADGAAVELNRIDTRNRTRTPDGAIDAILREFGRIWPTCDAVIVLDQVSEADCGVVSSRVRDVLAKFSRLNPTRFILADSRENVHRFEGVAIKPNARELCRTGESPLEALTRLAAGRNRPIFATQGEDGILLSVPGSDEIVRVEGFAVSGPVDIVGAGDSCSAGIACAKVCGLSDADAAAFGCLVASITIRQLGATGSASPAQVREAFALHASGR